MEMNLLVSPWVRVTMEKGSTHMKTLINHEPRKMVNQVCKCALGFETKFMHLAMRPKPWF
jgi:hypothetical protein